MVRFARYGFFHSKYIAPPPPGLSPPARLGKRPPSSSLHATRPVQVQDRFDAVPVHKPGTGATPVLRLRGLQLRQLCQPQCLAGWKESPYIIYATFIMPIKNRLVYLLIFYYCSISLDSVVTRKGKVSRECSEEISK